jgi:hypothetical protein
MRHESQWIRVGLCRQGLDGGDPADPEWDTFSKTWGHADTVRIFATGGMP